MDSDRGWEQKTLEELEGMVWNTPPIGTTLVKRCYELRKKPVGAFTTEDLRMMIGQGVGLQYLVPLAVERLSQDIWLEGDFFAGDLLKNVLGVKADFWQTHRDVWTKMNDLIKPRRDELQSQGISTAVFDMTS